MQIDLAYGDRKWQGLPVLRRLLEFRATVAESVRIPCIEHSSLERLGHLLEIASRAVEHKNELRARRDSHGTRELHEEIEQLRRALADHAAALKSQADMVSALRDYIETRTD